MSLTAEQVRDSLDWGWTSYRKIGWARDDGCKLYGAHFRVPLVSLGWQTLYVQFWARRPILALRHICQSGLDPNRFSDKTVN